MVLVTLNVNGKIFLERCKTDEEAKGKANQWLEEAKVIFPNGVFTPTYYIVLEKE